MTRNVVWHQSSVTKEERHKQLKQKSCVLWFTGLSGSGKSTLANALDHELFKQGRASFVLDGDNVRHGLNNDLGFTDDDRKENIRRIGEVSKLFVEAGTIVATAFISPFQSDRESVRTLFDQEEFIEIYVDCSLEVCEKRDVKGLYKKARSGEIANFTGISSPYEKPEAPELVVHTGDQSIEEAVDSILTYLKAKQILF